MTDFVNTQAQLNNGGSLVWVPPVKIINLLKQDNFFKTKLKFFPTDLRQTKAEEKNKKKGKKKKKEKKKHKKKKKEEKRDDRRKNR